MLQVLAPLKTVGQGWRDLSSFVKDFSNVHYEFLNNTSCSRFCFVCLVRYSLEKVKNGKMKKLKISQNIGKALL